MSDSMFIDAAHGALIPRTIPTSLGSLYGVEKALLRNRR